MKFLRIACFLIVFTSLLGCSEQPDLIRPTIQDVETPTQLPTVSVNIEIPEVTVTPAQRNFDIQYFCPEISLNSKQIPESLGTIVLSGENVAIDGQNYLPDTNQKSILWFWDTDSGERTTIQLSRHQEYYYFVTSPNKEKLAYTEGKTLSMPSDVIVLDHNGQETGKITLPDDWTLFD